jgi:hypothetical protein
MVDLAFLTLVWSGLSALGAGAALVILLVG